MAEQETYITEEVRALIGKESEPQTAFHVVESSEVRRFVQAVMDDDPIYWDTEYAQKSRYGTVVAPPLFPEVMFRREPGTPDPLAEAVTNPDFDGSGGGRGTGLPPVPLQGLPRLLNGGSEVEIYKLAAIGDRITARSKYVDIYEKKGRSGLMVFIVTETTYTNQHNEVLLIKRQTTIRR